MQICIYGNTNRSLWMRKMPSRGNVPLEFSRRMWYQVLLILFSTSYFPFHLVTEMKPDMFFAWINVCTQTRTKKEGKKSQFFHHKSRTVFSLALETWKLRLVIHLNQLLLTKYWTNDFKSAARWKLLIRWRQNDFKSAACYRLLNRWPRKPGD